MNIICAYFLLNPHGGLNWSNNTGPADTDYFNIVSGTVDFTEAYGTSASLRGIRQFGGTLNISGGTLEVANLASAFSTFNGDVFQTGGITTVNTISIGSEVGAQRPTSSMAVNLGLDAPVVGNHFTLKPAETVRPVELEPLPLPEAVL